MDGPAGPAWQGWAVGLLLLLLGGVAGWVSGQSTLGPPPVGAISPRPVPLSPERAYHAEHQLVTRLPTQVTAGSQLLVEWEIRNAGEAPWPNDLFRFIPEGAELPVIALPAKLAPNQFGRVRTVLTVPPINGRWQPSWILTGPSGPITGGRLLLSVRVHPDGP